MRRLLIPMKEEHCISWFYLLYERERERELNATYIWVHIDDRIIENPVLCYYTVYNLNFTSGELCNLSVHWEALVLSVFRAVISTTNTLRNYLKCMFRICTNCHWSRGYLYYPWAFRDILGFGVKFIWVKKIIKILCNDCFWKMKTLCNVSVYNK